MTKLILYLLVLTSFNGFCQIAKFTFTGSTGTPVSFPPDTQPTNGTLSEIARSGGINAASASGAFSAKSWPLVADGFDPDSYFTFTIQAEAGFELTLATISLKETRSSTGIRDWSIRSNLDGFASDITTFNVPDDTDSRVQTINLPIDFSNLSSSIPLEFRIYGFNAESSAGSWKLDNIEFFGSIAVPDTDPPGLLSASTQSSTSVLIQFDEGVDQSTGELTTNYLLNGSITPVSANRETDISQVTLTFTSQFQGGFTNTLEASNVKDIAGNMMTSKSINFTYVEILTASFRDIVINEIMADPNPVIGLPDAEFVELFNRSTKNIDLKNYTLSGDVITASEFILSAGEYVVLTDDSNIGVFFGNVIEMSTMGALTNGGETITLRDEDSSLDIDVATYSSSWYKDNSKDDGGYSLEQINPTTNCSGEVNWEASNHTSGGTPGEVNSIFDDAPDINGPNLISLEVISATEFELTFDEPMDEASLLSGTYEISDGLSFNAISPIIPELLKVSLSLTSPLTSGITYAVSVTGVSDCPGNMIETNTLEFFFDNKPPEISSIEPIYFDEILVVYDEEVDKSSAEIETNYLVNQGLGSPSNAKLIDENRVRLIFEDVLFADETAYDITLTNISDTLGNESSTNFPFTFNLPPSPEPGEILINELMADPSPPIGMPEVEYIELHNVSENDYNLNQLTISDANSTVRLSAYQLDAGEYVLLTPVNAGVEFSDLQNIVEVSGFLSLNNSLETVTQKRRDGTIIDQVTYTTEWYKDESKADGGYSLERIGPTSNCGEFFSWMASESESGGTPGQVNSIDGLEIEIPEITIVGFNISQENTVSIEFSNALALTVLNQSIVSVRGLTLENISTDIDSKTFNFRFAENLEKGVIYTLTINDLINCDGSFISELGIEFGEGAKPEYLDLLITELMPNPGETSILPNAEYVEIFNPTDKVISLAGVGLSDANNTSSLPSGLISPGEFIILTPNVNVDDMSSYGRVLGISNWPSLNNSEDLISLSFNGDFIHSINYSEAWYKDSNKVDGGWSLEMIDLTNPCGRIENWSASNHDAGGTPGSANSIALDNPDNFGPELISTFVEKDQVYLKFNEKLNPVDLVSTNISIEPTLEISSFILNRPVDDELRLTIEGEIKPRTNYTITIENIGDCLNNLSRSNQSTFTLPEIAEPVDIVLNEILFNPKPGGVDFVEIYNRSDKYINLKNWQIASKEEGIVANQKLITEDNQVIAPNQFLVFTIDPVTLKAGYPSGDESAFLSADLPIYPNDQGSVVLFNNEGITIDEFEYNEDLHFSLLDDVEGVSLERVSTEAPTKNTDNWKSAASTVGFATPGLRNSQVFSEANISGTITINPKVITPDNSGDADFATINYSFENGNNVATVSVYDFSGRLTKTLLQNATLPPEGFITWDGTNDQFQKVRVGYYVVVFEIFDSSGRTQTIRDKVVVGTGF